MSEARPDSLNRRIARSPCAHFRLGPPRVFVPVIKSAEAYPLRCIGGPLGYEEVDEVEECPLLVESPISFPLDLPRGPGGVSLPNP